MYKKSTKITSSTEDLSNYIEGFDVYNSALLNLLRDYSDMKVGYKITTRNYRPDLIAQDLYGSTGWMGLLMLTCGLSLEGYVRGATINVYPKEILTSILRSL